MARKDGTIAYNAAATIRRFWDEHPDADLFFHPRVVVQPGTFIIQSDIVDGYPPRVAAAVRDM